MRKTIFLVLSMILICFAAGTASVSAKEVDTIVDGSVLTKELEAESIVYPKQRGAYFANGSGHITVTGSGTVLLTGNTVARQFVDSVKITMHLQRLEGGSWVPVASYGPIVAYNTYTVSASRSYTVQRGYYYRMAGSHTVIEGDVFESAASATDGVWVG